MFRISSKTFIYFLFQIVIIFIFYDGIRSNLIYNGYISQLKEVLILILFGVALRENRGIVYTKIYNVGLLLFFTYHVIVGFCSLPFLLSFASFTIFYKSLQILMFIYASYYFYELTGVYIKQLFTFIVKVGISFVFINTILYFVELPIWEIGTARKWWGRISCGYPTMDVITLSYTLIILLYFENLQIKPTRRLIYTAIIIIGILLQATGTGLITLSLIIFVTILYFLFFKSSISLKKNARKILFIIIIVCFSIPIVINKYAPELYEQMYVIVENKIMVLLDDDNVEDEHNTLTIRENQYTKAIKEQNTDFKKIFGLGMSAVTYDADLASEDDRYIYIEDQYGINRAIYGYLGSFLYILFIIITFLEIIQIKHIKSNTKILFILSIMVFAINSKTLIPLVLFSNTIYFAILFAIMKRIKNQENFYLENLD